MKKTTYITFLLICITSLMPILSSNQIIDQVVWVIGDEPILKSDIETEILRMRYEKQSIDGDPYCVIPEQIAIQKLFIAQAKLDSITVSEASVEQQVEGRIKYFIQRIGSKEKVEEYFNKPIAKIKEEMTRTVEEQLLVQEMQQKITSSNKITPADVKRFYNELPKDSIPTIPEQVEVQIISIAPQTTPIEEERIKSELRDFREKIESGEYQFSTLAILYSEDRASAMQGGELGFMSKGKLVPEFANVAFSLYDPKKVSRIVETEFGYHIIQLIERKNDLVNCRHILLIPKVDNKQKDAAKLKLDSIAEDIRTGKFSFEEAALYSSEDKDTQQNEGLMINPTNGSTKFQLQDLPADIAKTVYNLQIGEISRPFVYINEKGKELVSIIRLKSKIKSHVANPQNDFQELKNIVTVKKNQELIEDWIKDKQKDTFIHINEEYKDCKFRYPGWIQ